MYLFFHFFDTSVLSVSPQTEILSVKVWRSGWPLVWTTMTDPSTEEGDDRDKFLVHGDSGEFLQL